MFCDSQHTGDARWLFILHRLLHHSIGLYPKDFPHVVTVPTEVELFNMLRMGRVDVALYSKLTGYSIIREMELEEIFHLEPPLATRDMYLYVHARHEALTYDIARVLGEIKQDGTYRLIVDRVMNEYGINHE